ncbi:MAG: hypothetical protein ABMB14_17950 [Myxococcota bacterium]
MNGEDMKFDVRSMKYRQRRGEISDEELAKHLASIPDEASEAEETRTQFVATFEERNYRN